MSPQVRRPLTDLSNPGRFASGAPGDTVTVAEATTWPIPGLGGSPAGLRLSGVMAAITGFVRALPSR